jgi:hypothetical protein
MRSSTICSKLTASLFFLVTATQLAGCWTPPVATVQPKGSPRLVLRAILVESAMRPGVVEAVDPAARTVLLKTAADASAQSYHAGSKLSTFDHITAGQKVAVSFAEQLTIYVSPDGRPPPAVDASPQTVVSNAKVLGVDPSYRLLTLEYPDGWRETVKVGRDVNLRMVEAGDDVAIELLEVVALATRKPWWR